jgi:SSS family solute:Na+ symporter
MWERLLALITFAVITGLVGLITYLWTRRHDHSSSSGYFLAGRSLGPVVIAGSLMLTNLSTEQLVGLNGGAYVDGFVVMAWEVIAAAALALMALFFLPRFLKSGVATVPQYLEERFDHITRAITTIIFVIAYAAILLPIVLYTGATGLNSMLDVQGLVGLAERWQEIVLLVVLVGGIGSIYAVLGGLGSVAISDTLNGIGLLVGGLLITYLGLQAVGDGGAISGLTTLIEQHPDKFDSIGTSEQSVPFSTIFTGVLIINLFYWCTNQQIIQRTFAARTLADGQKGVLLAGYLKVLTPLILVLPGVIAFHMFSGELQSQDQAYGRLVQEVLPWYLTGFFAAVMIGAILSSFNSALQSCGTLFSLGIYRSMIAPDASEAQVVRVGKWFGWAIAGISMVVAPFLVHTESIFSYLQKMNGLYFIPIFAVVVVGMLGRRVPAVAANVALVLGCLIIIAGYFIPPFSWWVGQISDYHFLGGVFAGLVLLMLIIRAISPRSEPWQQQHSGDVDMTPWRWAPVFGALLLVIVVSSYVLLAI